MKTTLVLALTAALALAGCKSPTSDLSHGPTQESSVKSSSPSQVYAAISGALEGFSGEKARFKQTDASKITIVLQDEYGQTVAGTSAVNPDSGGGFSIKDVDPGGYFVVATLPDASTNMAFLRTDHPGDNFISPGTTLACAWAKDQLAGKLIFMGDLPYADLLQVGSDLDKLLGDTPLAGTDDERFEQMRTLTDGQDAQGTKTKLATLEAALASRARANADKIPSYASDREYAAKKKKLGIT